MNKKSVVFVIAFALVFGNAAVSFADDEDKARIRELEKKVEELTGIVNQLVAQQQKPIRQATANEPEGIQDRVSILEEKVEKGSKWLEKIKTKGDLRLRHEMKTKPQGEDNNRQRLRFRWGLTAEVNDQTEIGFGFATGSSDSPLSTNQTLEQEFQSKNVWIDYAYAQYKANESFTFIGGKFKRPYFDTGMLWDGDVRMDGFAIKANHSLLEGGDWPETKGFATIGYFPLDDATAGSADLFITAEEVGIESKFEDFAKLKTGVIFYNIHGAEGYLTSDFAESKGTNTTEAFGGTRLANDFRIINPTVKLTFNDPLGLKIPVTLFYEYAKNVGAGPDDDNQAWSSGIQINKGGYNKGDWKFYIKYLRLEADSFLDSFPDGDYNGGGTNFKGWHVKTSYALMKNINFGVNYVDTKAITGAKLKEQIVQGDIVLKF